MTSYFYHDMCANLIRFVRAPDGRLLPDVHHELPSQSCLMLGAYPDVLQRAIKHDFASVWFGEPTLFDEKSVSILNANLEKAVFQTLSMAHKSGAVILGREAALAALEDRATECVIMAKDAGGADKKQLLRNPVYSRHCFEFSNRERLGAAFRRRAQVYLAVNHGQLAEKLTFFLRLHTRFNHHHAL